MGDPSEEITRKLNKLLEKPKEEPVPEGEEELARVVKALTPPTPVERMAREGGDYIRERMKEESPLRKIFPPVPAPVDDVEDVPELDADFFKDPILTRPGESLIDKVADHTPLYAPEFKDAPPFEPIGPIIEANPLKPSKCGGCPHSAHLGPCMRRRGQTAHPCPCIRGTLAPKCPSCGSNPDVDCICKGP